MKKQPLVSVIIPVYNTGNTIKKCLDSIILQSYKSLEIIIVDDGSIDDIYEKLNLFSVLDKRIVVVYQENYGVSVSRNVGISVSKGSWICFCDSDDWIEEDLIEKLVKTAEESQSDFVVSGFVTDYYQNGSLFFTHKAGFSSTLIGDKATLSNDFGYAFRSEHVILQSPCAKLYKKSILDESHLIFDRGIVCYEDFSFNLLYMCLINKYAFLNFDKYHYIKVVSGNSILKRPKDDLVNEVHSVYLSLNRFFKQYEDSKLRDEMNQWLFEVYRIPIIRLLSASTLKVKKEIIDRLMKDKGYLEITQNSLTHKAIKRIYRLKMYRVILLIMKYRLV